MQRLIGILAIWLGAGVAAGTAWAGTVYQVDDGVAEGSVGAAGYTLFTLNHFTIVPGANTLTGIEVLAGFPGCGCISDGMLLTAYLWSDPNHDGDPSDAQVLASASGTVSTSDIGQFVNIPIGPLTLPDGTSFFAGIGYPTSAYALFDFSSPAGQSWLVTFHGTPDPNHLASTSFDPYPANFLVRVEGESAVPEPSTWILLLTGLAGAVSARARARR
jgi:hypothetical protein